MRFRHRIHRQSKALQCSRGWTCLRRSLAAKDTHLSAHTAGSSCSRCVSCAQPKGNVIPTLELEGCSSRASWCVACPQHSRQEPDFLKAGKIVCSSCTNWNWVCCHSCGSVGLIPIVRAISHSIALSREKTDLVEHVSVSCLLSSHWTTVLGDIVSFEFMWGN